MQFILIHNFHSEVLDLELSAVSEGSTEFNSELALAVLMSSLEHRVLLPWQRRLLAIPITSKPVLIAHAARM